jgi:phosphoribosylanthranilate isomerase
VRPLVKICGVTTPEDALAAARLGADLLGLNFYPPSPRCLGRERAVEIARAVRDEHGEGVGLVGLFVDAEPREIGDLDDAVGLDLVQFHGGETPADLLPFGPRALKAFRRPEPPAGDELASYGAAWGFLFDFPHGAPGASPGGTGHAWDWARVAGLETDRPVLVAGGIGPANARRALAVSGAAGIDVCSGVESAPGVKDHDLMTRLFEEVLRDGESRET